MDDADAAHRQLLGIALEYLRKGDALDRDVIGDVPVEEIVE